ncbi:MAG TPA: dienelactone hydrolase family protein [Pyrinomonadaceae bacterium]|jgi:carboxymethylenebutenolidase
MHTEILSFETNSGATTAFAAIPEAASGRAVLVIQEWWGVNGHIKDICSRYASEGFIAIAPDLYRGRVAKDADEAAKLMHDLQLDDGIDTIKHSIDTARSKYGISHFGITGYCMGGTYTLRSACLIEGISAAAAFYGDVPEEEILKKLTVPTIFISGTRDKWINPEKVAGLEDVVERYELPLQSVKYEADHAFFNDTRPEVYNETAARDAWAMVVGSFSDKL